MKHLFTLIMLTLATMILADTSPERPPIGTRLQSDEILFKASIDAIDDIVIYNGKLCIEHVSRNKPQNITIDGKTWEPTWEANTSSNYTRFNPKLVSLKDIVAKVTLIKGRGNAVIQEQPSKENKYRLIIRLTDGGSGADELEIKISLNPKGK